MTSEVPTKSIPYLKDWNHRPGGFLDKLLHPGHRTHLQRLQPRPLQRIGQDVSHLIFLCQCHQYNFTIPFHHSSKVSRTCSLVRDVSLTSAHSNQLIRATSLIGFTPKHMYQVMVVVATTTTTTTVEQYRT